MSWIQWLGQGLTRKDPDAVPSNLALGLISPALLLHGVYAVPESCLPSASLFLLRGLCRDKWRGFRITARRSRIRYLRRSIAFNSSSSDTRDSPCFLFRQMEFEFPSRVTCILKNLTYRAKSIRTFIPPPVKENIRVYFRFRPSLSLSLF